MRWWLVMASILSPRAEDFQVSLRQSSGNHLDYKRYVQDLCVDIVQSEEKPCSVTQDCSALGQYECAEFYDTAISDVAGAVEMVFEGHVNWWSFQDCGEGAAGSCPWCTNYRTCVGPMVETDTQDLPEGRCIVWEYSTQGSRDAFEDMEAPYAAAYSLRAALCAGGGVQLLRPSGGARAEAWRCAAGDWTFGQLRVPYESSYYMRFFLGSYDATGGGLVGARLQLRNLRSQACLDDATLSMGPDATSTTATSSSVTVSRTSGPTSTSTNTTSTQSTTRSTTSTSSTHSISSTTTTSRTSSSTSISTSSTASNTSTSSSTSSSSSSSATTTRSITTATSSDSTASTTLSLPNEISTATRTSTSTSTTSSTTAATVTALADVCECSCGADEVLMALVAPEDKIEELAETADDATVPKAEGRLRSTLRELGVEEAELRQALAERETLGAQLEQLRKAHFLLQHRLMNETRLREELQRTRVKQNGRGAG
ncbi:unnamed protein product [Effrenium voratum]|nr:unnamed protein product [Effrenium voratum]